MTSPLRPMTLRWCWSTNRALVLAVNKQLVAKDDEGSGKPTWYFPMREGGRIK